MSGVRKQINEAGSESVLFAHKASVLLQKKLNREALELCREGIKRFPFYVEGHYMLARSYQAEKRYQEAISEYETVLHYMPGHVKAMKALAYLYLKDGQEAKAYSLLRTFLLYDPLNEELVRFLKSNDLYRVLYEPPSPPPKERPVAAEQETLDTDFDDETEEDLFEDTEPAYEEVPVLNLDGDDLPPLDSDLLPGEPAEAEVSVETEMQSGQKELEQEEFERNNIVDNLDESDSHGGALDLDQFDNTEDDFSTVMDGVFQKPQPEEALTEEQVFEDEEDVQDAEPEALAEERPMLDTSLIFNESKQADEAGDEQAAVDDFDNLAAELENQSFEEAEAIEESMAESIAEVEPPALQVEEQETEQAPPLAEPEDVEAADQKKAESAPAKETLPLGEPEVQEDEQVSVDDVLSNPSLLTPTFGEILIAQKKFEDARQVFVELSNREPDNIRFKKKIEFLDKLVAMGKKN